MAIIEAQIIMIYLIKEFDVELVNRERIAFLYKLSHTLEDENLIRLKCRK